MHECVLSAKNQAEHGVHAIDIAKALIDAGFHPPTVYFPLIVKEAMMIEPTETESKETLDAFIEAMKRIAAARRKLRRRFMRRRAQRRSDGLMKPKRQKTWMSVSKVDFVAAIYYISK